MTSTSTHDRPDGVASTADPAFVYRCLDCGLRIGAPSRPDDCARCGGDLVNESFERWSLRGR